MLIPQIGDGAFPPGLETENVSVRHCVAVDWEAPLETALRARPKKVFTSLAVTVEGPVIMKESKSRRSWKFMWNIFSDGPKQSSAETEILVIRTEISVCGHYKEIRFWSKLSLNIFFLAFNLYF